VNIAALFDRALGQWCLAGVAQKITVWRFTAYCQLLLIFSIVLHNRLFEH
jgi:hypothetical protein